MKTSYSGPLRHEPLALELHNTMYALRGERIDGLETPEDLSVWLAALADRLPPAARDADPARQPEFVALRDAVREVLHAALEGKRPPAGALEAVNAAATRAPVSPLALADARGRLQREVRYHTDDATDVALAAFAADAIALLTGPDREGLRSCGAPGCVLMFLKDHPRRTWCSSTCGNRARQARHYARARHDRS
ncbi:MAG TPA: ABATE domain-containing protein [Thermoleophilaceae bacterium]|nr:ABATE domain-containing protein [Thermoleophilaceae bacterium]